MHQDAQLRRARNGDEQAFRELTEPHRAELRVHCYRMLGSVDDAEDIVQETLLAAWRGLPDFEGRSSLRTWLYKIATNRCLNALRDSRPTVVAPMPPFEPPEPTRYGEVTWLQPFPDALLPGQADATAGPEARYQARETIELAFVSALQRLPPRQLAVLVLRDVLGFRTAEVADMLATSQLAVKSSVQRARAALRHQRSERGSAGSADSADGVRVQPSRAVAADRALAQRFADAFGADDIDAVIALLTDDAWLAMPPAPHQYQGRAAIAGFLRASATWRAGRRFRLLPAPASGQPAFACYLDRPSGDGAEATGLIVLTTDGVQIRAVTRFLDASLLRHFALPQQLD